MIERLAELLHTIQCRRARDFSGIGLIVSDAPELLPIVSLRPQSVGNFGKSAIDNLIDISSTESEYHDGFHVISSNFEILLVAQYFSPQILPQLPIDRRKRFGGRYLAAMFGSGIRGVSATGVASNGFGIAVFQSGAEVFFKSAR
jgi:hypothetical protein